jgi:TatD DNase family protein
MKMYSESHCHLRGASVESVLRAEEAGLELILAAGIDVESSAEAVSAANRHSSVKGCVGIHPWRADTFSPGALGDLRELSMDLEVAAISEIGLDFVGRRTAEWESTDEVVAPDIQRRSMRAQIALAIERGLPVLVHDRTPTEEVLDVLEETGVLDIGAAIHGFSKDPVYARRCVEMEVYLSIGKRTIEQGEKQFLEAVRQTPLEWLLTETDTGEPTGVISVAEMIAELKGVSKEEVGRVTTENLKRLVDL